MKSFLDGVRTFCLSLTPQSKQITVLVIAAFIIGLSAGVFLRADNKDPGATVADHPMDIEAFESLALRELSDDEVAKFEKTVGDAAAFVDVLSLMFSDDFQEPLEPVKTGQPTTRKGEAISKKDVHSYKASIDQPLWQRYAVKTNVGNDTARVVIIIDDMGLSRSMTKRIAKLQGPMDLAFLPYADNLQAQVDMIRKAGHEAMIHMPMEPMNGQLDMGPIALKSSMKPDVLKAYLELGLSKASGYVGINNHMGSRLTQDQAAMDNVMGTLKNHGLLFVDSMTIHTSVAAKTAAANEVPYAIRDVFLDHVPTAEGVAASLKRLEDMALQNGLAIAIGHPKSVTIDALEAWLPTLKDKGISLVPVSQIVHKPARPLSAHAQSHLQQPQ